MQFKISKQSFSTIQFKFDEKECHLIWGILLFIAQCKVRMIVTSHCWSPLVTASRRLQSLVLLSVVGCLFPAAAIATHLSHSPTTTANRLWSPRNPPLLISADHCHPLLPLASHCHPLLLAASHHSLQPVVDHHPQLLIATTQHPRLHPPIATHHYRPSSILY